MREWVIVPAATLVVVLGAAFAVASWQKPEIVEKTYISQSPPPATLHEMTLAAQAVVLARAVEGAWAVERMPGGLVETIYPLEMVEILKPHARVPLPPAGIEVPMYGGVLELDTHVRHLVVEPSAEPLQPGRTYVLFLNWHLDTDRLIPAFGPASVFDVTDDMVRPLNPIAGQYANLKSQDFIARVRVR